MRGGENEAYDRREPGLFKVECEGDGMVSLCSKSYCVMNKKGDKISCKGVQASHNRDILNFGTYKKVLFNEEVRMATNKGFRVDKSRAGDGGYKMNLDLDMKTFDDIGDMIGENNGHKKLVQDSQYFTYEQVKIGLCPIYDKRILLDTVHSIPLNV
jgi:hypothetical protein